MLTLDEVLVLREEQSYGTPDWWYFEGYLDVLRDTGFWQDWIDRDDERLIHIIAAYELGYADAKGDQDL